MSFLKKICYKTGFTTKVYTCIEYRSGLVKDWFKYKLPIILAKGRNPNIAFLIMTPNHSNIGDSAIASAEQKMLAEQKIKYIELNINEFNIFNINNWLHIINGSPIYVHGGGNLGTLWFGIEKNYRKLLAVCPESKVLFFPNTIYYEDSEFGKTELENSKKIYNSHKNLTIYARENTSYEYMKNTYPNANVKLAPDMVIYLNYSENQTKRSGCLLCLRNDIEKTLAENEKNQLVSFADNNFKTVSFTDMYFKSAILAELREFAIFDKINQFKTAELVITDRLHGMIFCAVTGTPCIVINSKSPKVKGCYEWIKHLPYIEFCDNIEDIEKIYSKMPKGSFKYDNSHLLPLFDELKKDIIALTE